MKISLGTVEVSNRERAAIGAHYGEKDGKLAPRDVCRRAIVSNGTGWIDVVVRWHAEQRELESEQHGMD